METHGVLEANVVPPAPVPAGTPDGSAPGRALRVLFVVGLASFLAFINFAASAPFFSQIARDLGTTVPLLGQVATIMTFLSAALGLALGPIADRYGHRRLMAAGVIAVAVNLVGTGLAPSYPFLLGLTIVGGLGDAILFGLPLAIAGMLFSGDGRRRAIAWASAALPVGAVLGVPLLTIAGEFVSWRVVFLGAGSATLVAALVVLAWLPADHGTRHEARDAPQQRFPRPADLLDAYRPLMRHRPLLVLYAASGLRMAGWTGMTMYLGAFLAEELEFGPASIGLSYMLSGAMVLCGSVVAGRSHLLRRLPLRRVVSWTIVTHGVLLGLVFLVPLGLSGAFAVIPALALLALGSFISAVTYVGLMTLTLNEARGGVATTMVLAGSVLNLGVSVAGAVGGLLLATGGWLAFGLGLPVFAIAATVLLVWTRDG